MKARFKLHSKDFGLKQICSAVKNFATKALKYKASLKLSLNFLLIAMCPLVMSPYSHAFVKPGARWPQASVYLVS